MRADSKTMRGWCVVTAIAITLFHMGIVLTQTVQMPSEASFLDDLKASMKDTDDDRVFMITKLQCRYSKNMRQWLDDREIPYVDYIIDLPGHQDIRKRIGYPNHTFPLVFLHGQIIGDYGRAVQNYDLIKLIRKDEYKPVLQPQKVKLGSIGIWS